MQFRTLSLALVLAAASHAAVWPENFGGCHRESAAALQPKTDPALWDEYGFKNAETAAYAGEGRKFTATAYRLADSTGAMAAFQWLRPADAKPSPLAPLAAETGDGLLLVHGNYLLEFHGYQPPAAELAAFEDQLKNVESAQLPVFATYLPDRDLVPNSERYILGPEGLKQFDPAIPPSTAAFSMGAEAQAAAFHGPGGDMKLALFNYPTPQIAMQRVQEFQKIPGALAKRSGPLVAVIVAPPNADAAEKLLSLVRYQAQITLDERVPTRRDNIGDLVVNAFTLAGILLILCAAGGLVMGLIRVSARRSAKANGAEPMILLHLDDRGSRT